VLTHLPIQLLLLAVEMVETSQRDSQDLAGRNAVVTGASSGIGRAIAEHLAAAGAGVLVHARSNRQGAEETAANVRSYSVTSHIELADLSCLDAQDELVERAWQWRDIDIWVNNAGSDVLTGEAAKWSFEEKLEQLWKVDVTATMRLSRRCGELMKQRGRGVMLSMGWSQARDGMAGDSGQMFAAVKGAVMAFTQSLAKSLAPEVRVNCLAPGWIRTSWGEQSSSYWQQRARDESLLGRWGTSEDVAQVARFLVSPAAGFITGQIINIDGGQR